MANAPAVRISIVVACRNERNAIHDLLRSILSQDLTEPWEVIIADGMSDDGTREILEEYRTKYPWLKIIDNPLFIVSTGLNAAIREAQGEIVIRMDGHTQYAPHYCRTCVDTLERTGADNVGGPARTKGRGILGCAVAAAFHSPFSTGGAKFHNPSYRGWVDTVPYGCWRKSVLEKIGMFDEHLVRNQDDELNLRLRRSGGRIWQDPSIVSCYSPRSNLSNLFRQYFQYGYWKVAVIRKHRLPSSMRHLIPVIWLLINALLATAMAVTSLVHFHVRLVDVVALWLTITALYLAAAMTAATFAAKNQWSIFPYLPVVFATYHLSYGLGFAIGLIHFRSSPVSVSTLQRSFARISR